MVVLKCVLENQEWWRRSLVMFHFLAAFLSLGDMHDGNFGREGDFETDQVPKPMIHDFMMSEYTDPGAKFLNASNFLRFINLETGQFTPKIPYFKRSLKNSLRHSDSGP